jgi:hypothetical protein
MLSRPARTKSASLALAVVALVCAVWAFVAHNAVSSARGELASVQGTYYFYSLGQPTNPTWQEAATITPTDIAMAKASNDIDNAQTSISRNKNRQMVAILLLVVSGSGAVTTFGHRRREASSRNCPHCASRIKLQARMCPRCQREVASASVYSHA